MFDVVFEHLGVPIIRIIDIIFAVIFMIFILLISYAIYTPKKNTITKRYYIWGLLFRWFCCFMYWWVSYIYYNGAADMTFYNRDSYLLAERIISEGFTAIPFPSLSDTTANVSLLGGIICFFTFNSVLVSCLIATFFSFIGCWKLFELLNELFPSSYKYILLATLFIPSMSYWSVSISKESFSIWGVGLFLHGAYFLLVLRQIKIIHLINFLFGFSLVLYIKPYIITTLIPCFGIWVYLEYVKKVRNLSLKILTAQVFLLIIGSITLFSFWLTTSNVEQLGSSDNVLTRVEKLQSFGKQLEARNDNLVEGGGKSAYNISSYGEGFEGFILSIPFSIVTAWFRPFIWEVENPLMLIAALEALWILLLFVWAFTISNNPIQAFSIVSKNPFLVCALLFSILFSVLTVNTSLNFGSLMRYKIPMMPFLISMLYIIINKKG